MVELDTVMQMLRMNTMVGLALVVSAIKREIVPIQPIIVFALTMNDQLISLTPSRFIRQWKYVILCNRVPFAIYNQFVPCSNSGHNPT